MAGYWLSLKDIPAEGREFSFSDQSAWEAYWREFRLSIKPGRPLEATFTVLPQKGGVLVRGRLTGSVILECSRCAGDVEHLVDLPIDLYEEAPGGAEAEQSSFLRREGDHMELNPAEMLWAEFSLNLPVKLLCSKYCKGLCPKCGRNLNAEDCECPAEEGDPRLEALRGLKVEKKG